MRTSTLALAIAWATGCTPFDVPDDISGVFPCDVDDECPGKYQCIAKACRLGSGPSLVIINPEDEMAFPAGADGILNTSVRIGGENLALTDPGADTDAEFGRGQVLVFVDGVQAATITAGQLENQVSADVIIQATPGAHQISAVAQMSNGARYDNPAASAASLLWVDDGEPHVGIKRPAAGTIYGLEAELIEIEVATLNFDIVRANPNMNDENGGHVHLHYNASFPACVDTPPCDNGFISIAAPIDESRLRSIVVEAQIPASAAGDATLTATLRQATHYNFNNSAGNPVWTDLRIRREALAP